MSKLLRVRLKHTHAVSLALSLCWVSASAFAQGPPPPPPLGAPPVPGANLLTPEKIKLGHALFWDEQLSLTGTVACGTCHRPSGGGGDPRTVADPAANVHPGADGVFGNADDIHASRGVPAHANTGNYQLNPVFGVSPQVGARNANSVLTAAYSPRALFWDGRAGSAFNDPITAQVLITQDAALENQAMGPLVDQSEMAHAGATLAQVAARLQSAKPLALASNVPLEVANWIAQRSYAELFTETFGSREITPARIAFAIASYERTLGPTQTPFDAQNGGAQVMTQLELQGRQVFQGNGCNACHSGALLSDSSFRYIGLRPQNDDLGRFNVTNNAADRGRFRVPSLRNVEFSAPYMHTGQFNTLEEVVEFYNRGGDFDAPNKDPQVRPRNLSAAQKAALVAFLRRPLTDPRVAAESGPFARPTLYTETSRVPQIIGSPTSGSGGFAPLLTALEPPHLGNKNFTVVLSNALGGAAAQLIVGAVDPGVQSFVPAADFARVDVLTSGSGGGNGLASAQLRIPNRADVLGQTLYGRFYVEDPAAGNALAVSAAFKITVFGDSDVLLNDDFE